MIESEIRIKEQKLMKRRISKVRGLRYKYPKVDLDQEMIIEEYTTIG